MPRSSAHATVTSSKSKVCVRRHTRHLTILPLLQFVPRPFRVRSAPYFVVSTPRLSSIRSALEIANRTVGPSSASPSSSRHPTTALHPTPRPVYLRIRCNVAQMTVAIVTTDRALACATPITATSSSPRARQSDRSNFLTIRRAIVHANRTAAKQYLGPTALQHSEP